LLRRPHLGRLLAPRRPRPPLPSLGPRRLQRQLRPDPPHQLRGQVLGARALASLASRMGPADGPLPRALPDATRAGPGSCSAPKSPAGKARLRSTSRTRSPLSKYRRRKGSGAGDAEGGDPTRFFGAAKCHLANGESAEKANARMSGPRRKTSAGRSPAAAGPAPATGAPPRLEGPSVRGRGRGRRGYLPWAAWPSM